jgi:hypothetical protein
MAGDLNEMRPYLNSWLATAWSLLLRDYTNRNSCFTCGPDKPFTFPCEPSATPVFLIF